jgi:ADP-heptose:LPS heptosyltransferase
VKSLRERFTADGRCIVGLSWASKAPYYSEQKSAHLRDFEPILKLPGIRFVDLQYGDTLAERTAAKESTGVEVCRVEDVDNHQDIDGLAALIAACDVVVTVSNTTVHLAGALGKTVFLLLPYSQGSLWYWHSDREDSPWYPSARLFRQPAIGDWGSVIRRVARELDRLVP